MSWTAEVMYESSAADHEVILAPDFTGISEQSSALIVPRIYLPELNLHSDLLMSRQSLESL
jgi:hypothetical protein